MSTAPHNNHGPLALTEATIGLQYQIDGVDIDGVLGDRLVELGLTTNAPIEVLRQAPLGGPMQIRVRGYLLTIRAAQARRVRVSTTYSIA